MLWLNPDERVDCSSDLSVFRSILCFPKKRLTGKVTRLIVFVVSCGSCSELWYFMGLSCPGRKKNKLIIAINNELFNQELTCSSPRVAKTEDCTIYIFDISGFFYFVFILLKV